MHHAVTRALSQGHASIERWRQAGKGLLALNPMASLLRLLESLVMMLVIIVRRVVRNPGDILILPLALLAGTAYYVLVGEIMSLVSPRRSEERYRF